MDGVGWSWLGMQRIGLLIGCDQKDIGIERWTCWMEPAWHGRRALCQWLRRLGSWRRRLFEGCERMDQLSSDWNGYRHSMQNSMSNYIFWVASVVQCHSQHRNMGFGSSFHPLKYTHNNTPIGPYIRTRKTSIRHQADDQEDWLVRSSHRQQILHTPDDGLWLGLK